jgi:hypothetical protein
MKCDNCRKALDEEVDWDFYRCDECLNWNEDAGDCPLGTGFCIVLRIKTSAGFGCSHWTDTFREDDA